MDIKNIDKAAGLISELKTLEDARRHLSESGTTVRIDGVSGKVSLPPGLRMNVLGVVNCEYERVRKEVERL